MFHVSLLLFFFSLLQRSFLFAIFPHVLVGAARGE